MTIYSSFWLKLDKKSALKAALFFLVVIAVEIAATIYLPNTKKPIFDSLEKFDYAAFMSSLFTMFYIYVALYAAQGLKSWLGARLAFICRDALMKTIKKQWALTGTTITQSCTRLNDDVRVSTEVAMCVFVEVFISAIIVIGLIIGMLGQPLLLVSGLVYATVSVGLALLFRNPIVSRKVALLNAEGAHRLALTKVSSGHGDYTSKERWQELREAFVRNISMLMRYRLFSAIQMSVMLSVPFLLLVPDYFSHSITLGDVMQGVLSFDLLVLNAAIWVTLYPQVTEAQAAMIRVNELYKDVHNQGGAK
jgi:ABC-type uncharacterized transport system fused permease/ATPase subunit